MHKHIFRTFFANLHTISFQLNWNPFSIHFFFLCNVINILIQVELNFTKLIHFCHQLSN